MAYHHTNLLFAGLLVGFPATTTATDCESQAIALWICDAGAPEMQGVQPGTGAADTSRVTFFGTYFIADDKMFILNDDGTLTIAKPSVEKYIQLDQVRVLKDGHDAWAPFAVANGYLIMRDADTMVCIDLNV